MHKNTIKEEFFYAHDDSEFYDDTIELTVPNFHLVYKTISDILNFHFQYQYGDAYKEITGIILDVGAGTGTESISAMKELPNMHTLAIDICEPMKNLYVKNYTRAFAGKKEKRFEYIVEDFRTISGDDERINFYYKSLSQKACKAAISAYCFHHFTYEEKKLAYQKVFDMLEPGGIFVNLDVFTFNSPSVKKDAHLFDIDFIKRGFDNPNFEISKKVSREQCEILKDKWVNHLNMHHLDSAEQDTEILKEIGFEDVECVLRYWHQGIVRAIKPIK